MRMEQWEIDLRNQINENFKDSKAKRAREIYKEFQDFFPKQKNQKRDITIMLFLMIFLGLASIFVYEYKTNSNFSSWMTDFIITEENDLKFSKTSDSINTKLEKLENENLILKNKVALLGILFNENVSIMRKNYWNLLFFNRDWTINSMPDHIQLMDSDVEYLKEYVSKR